MSATAQRWWWWARWRDEDKVILITGRISRKGSTNLFNNQSKKMSALQMKMSALRMKMSARWARQRR
jgi:hypothetical protein